MEDVNTTRNNNFLFLFLNFDSLLEFNSRKKLPTFDELNKMEFSGRHGGRDGGQE